MAVFFSFSSLGIKACVLTALKNQSLTARKWLPHPSEHCSAMFQLFSPFLCNYSHPPLITVYNSHNSLRINHYFTLPRGLPGGNMRECRYPLAGFYFLNCLLSSGSHESSDAQRKAKILIQRLFFSDLPLTLLLFSLKRKWWLVKRGLIMLKID